MRSILATEQVEANEEEWQTEQLTHSQPTKGQITQLCVGNADEFHSKAKNGVTDGKEA